MCGQASCAQVALQEACICQACINRRQASIPCYSDRSRGHTWPLICTSSRPSAPPAVPLLVRRTAEMV